MPLINRHNATYASIIEFEREKNFVGNDLSSSQVMTRGDSMILRLHVAKLARDQELCDTDRPETMGSNLI